MLKKKIQFSLLSFVMLGLANFPVQAQTTNSQAAVTEANINGNYNTVNQVIYQTVINRPGKKNGNGWKDEKNRDNDNSFARGNSEDRRNDKKGEHHDKD